MVKENEVDHEVIINEVIKTSQITKLNAIRVTYFFLTPAHDLLGRVLCKYDVKVKRTFNVLTKKCHPGMSIALNVQIFVSIFRNKKLPERLIFSANENGKMKKWNEAEMQTKVYTKIGLHNN